MDYQTFRKLSEKVYFTVEDIAALLGIKRESARVLCTRYVKNGSFIRLKNNFYLLNQGWDKISREGLFKVANFLQVPSYISMMTALSAYEVTTQVQANFVESASLKRSARFTQKGAVFNFYKLKKEYYFDFENKNGIFIASKEKAFVDSIYLYSFGKYRIDFSSLDVKKLDLVRVREIVKAFPQKARVLAEQVCRI